MIENNPYASVLTEGFSPPSSPDVARRGDFRQIGTSCGAAIARGAISNIKYLIYNFS
jgi:hypothetical protein